MLESVFIVMLAIAFVLFILAVENRSQIYCMMSLILWLIILAQSLWIEVPRDTEYTEYVLSAASLMFIFANLVLVFVFQFDWRKRMP